LIRRGLAVADVVPLRCSPWFSNPRPGLALLGEFEALAEEGVDPNAERGQLPAQVGDVNIDDLAGGRCHVPEWATDRGPVVAALELESGASTFHAILLFTPCARKSTSMKAPVR
jgi:hypothetical protein